jgi:hypothetical protein
MNIYSPGTPCLPRAPALVACNFTMSPGEFVKVRTAAGQLEMAKLMLQ